MRLVLVAVVAAAVFVASAAGSWDGISLFGDKNSDGSSVPAYHDHSPFKPPSAEHDKFYDFEDEEEEDEDDEDAAPPAVELDRGSRGPPPPPGALVSTETMFVPENRKREDLDKRIAKYLAEGSSSDPGPVGLYLRPRVASADKLTLTITAAQQAALQTLCFSQKDPARNSHESGGVMLFDPAGNLVKISFMSAGSASSFPIVDPSGSWPVVWHSHPIDLTDRPLPPSEDDLIEMVDALRKNNGRQLGIVIANVEGLYSYQMSPAFVASGRNVPGFLFRRMRICSVDEGPSNPALLSVEEYMDFARQLAGAYMTNVDTGDFRIVVSKAAMSRQPNLTDWLARFRHGAFDMRAMTWVSETASFEEMLDYDDDISRSGSTVVVAP
eukprot:gnl/Hemi2/28645_TR9507_c0_g1_i1.p1 gnl/Hemi2/28645_TR9507_c0_g1~~gnl/Hemi2/28645_TR9507_c0_g1_i1.p1  ORF type:complete len:383 (+),score=90.43 gnl/Hemi2/28645_TR9507_c0_g1_i1:80-1228(+)